MAAITLDKVGKTYAGGVQAVHSIDLRIDDGEFRGARRPLGLRQVHPAADGRRAGDDHLGRGEDRRPGGQPGRAGRPRHRHGVPELRALSAHDGAPEPRLRAEEPQDGQGRDRPPGGRGREHPGDRQLSRPQAARAVGRPAPARGDGPRHRARTRRVPVRRAAVEPRRQAAGPDARRDQAVAGAARAPPRSTSPTTSWRR